MLLIINRLSVLRVPDIHPASSVAYTSILYSHIAFTIIKKKKKKSQKEKMLFCSFICIGSSLQSERGFLSRAVL